MNIGYADFRHLCKVDDPERWAECLSLRGDGVYVKEPPAGLLASEAAALSTHPTGDLSEPALRFPCTLPELQVFLEDSGCYGCIDPFVMARWVQAQAEKRETAENPLTTTGSDHIAGKLTALNQAAERFWANADRNDRATHPKNSDVAAWLVKRGYSQTLADKAVNIIRPKWAPSGRKPEE